MSGADQKVLASVTSFLDRQKLDCESVHVQSGIQLKIQSGSHKATVNVYNSGKIVVGGSDSPLKTLLFEMKKAIEEGGVGLGQALPFEIDKFPETIRSRVPGCDPVIVVFVEEAIKCIRNNALLAAAFMIGAA